MFEKKIKAITLSLICALGLLGAIACAQDSSAVRAAQPVKTVNGTEFEQDTDAAEESAIGGGYAVTGQLKNVGYTAKIYDATNGLPTSDANYILGASDGYIWIGGYSGIIRYDGSTFERLNASEGLTSGRVIFEDHLGRLWIGTNDNGVVVLDGEESARYTYKDGLASSSIRTFTEDNEGNVYIGSTSGISYVDNDGSLHRLDDERLNYEMIFRLVTSPDGTIYGCTRNGVVFLINDKKVSAFYSSDELGIETVTTIYADPDKADNIYLGTSSSNIYRGKIDKTGFDLKPISVDPANNIYWITSACGRIWVISNQVAGYLDGDKFNVLKNVPMDNSMEMMTSDYQGNLWFASTRQGVMKVVANNFVNLTENAGLPEDVVNSTCLFEKSLYIGTDNGLQIIDKNNKTITNELKKLLQGTRIRCLKTDKDGNLWISAYTNSLGLICYTTDHEIIRYTEADGMPGDGVRCTTIADDGSILAGVDGGLAIIKNGKIKRTITESPYISNTLFLTVEEGDDKTIYVGTDGDGIYAIKGNDVEKIGRSEGLTSDVILRIKKDTKRGVYWIITSNSIEYLKDGKITNVDTFPYNNNFDIYYDKNDHLWILSSYGVYCVAAEDMLSNTISDYRLYTISNGLSAAPTANAFSELDENGDLYISGRTGVSRVNIDHYFQQDAMIKTGVGSILCDAGEIVSDARGVYTIPPVVGRIQITPAVLDYTMTNPTVHVFLEGADDSGITADQSNLTTLEYTGLSYGSYDLHIQILDQTTNKVYQDETFPIEKEPRIIELLIVRFLLLLLLALTAGFIVWRFMTGTIIRRQYEQIRQAKDEAERANSAKSRFLANMSHEIRTPINTIMGMDEMILREDATDVPKGYFMSVVNYALDIKSASESLLGLINDLLDMSKIESGKMHLVEQDYDVTELFRSIVTMIRVRSSEKDLSFDVAIDANLPSTLYGDAGKVKQVVLNLLTNAVKYTEKGGFTLTVLSESIQDDTIALRISVKDTGIGVKPEDMDKLFTAYERLDEEKNSGIQGTGLGLDISRRFAELMEGRLWCESVYGEGSEFLFTFRQRIVDKTPIGTFTERSDDAVKGPYVPQFVAPDARILVVDDNSMNLTVIKGLLKATKMSVTTAGSGEECLDLLSSEDFHVVLLDHMMPGMDGVETVAEIRKNNTELPVYALTANTTAEEDFYKSKGFNGYLSKPIDSQALEKAIMKHLPDELMQKATLDDAVEDLAELPEDKLWLNDLEGLSVGDGIKNSGGISPFLFSLDLFLDTIDTNTKVICGAFDDDDIRMYTVKVHALKSSARIIGANELSALCEALENAGNRGDIDFIKANHDKMITDYNKWLDKLAPLRESDSSDDREPIPEEELKEAYEALKEVVPQMDYDSVEMILEQLAGYKLPGEDKTRIDELGKLLKLFDWDNMEKLLEV